MSTPETFGPDGVAAVVLAAGSGSRMGTGALGPKQFLPLIGDERLVDRAVATCRAVADWVGVAIPEDAAWDGETIDAVITGGLTRMDTVAAAVAAVPADARIVLVHSASHPLASTALLQRTVAAVRAAADGAVAVLDAVETIKHHNPDGTLSTIGRAGYGTAQAPMAYRRASLDQAMTALAAGALGTDIVEESMAVEAVGGRVVAVQGEATNLHVTDPTSLAMVRRLADLVD